MSLFGEKLDSEPKNDQLTPLWYCKFSPKNGLHLFVTIYQNLTSCERSEKSNEPSRESSITDGGMNGW